MVRFIVHRSITIIIALWLIVTATFIIMHTIPGGPFSRDKRVPPAVLENLTAKYHLDDSYARQYFDYFSGLSRLDFGPSFRYDFSVKDIIVRAFPVSAQLGAVSVVLALILGLGGGIISAYSHNKWPDYLVTFISSLFLSVPSFILASLLIFIFAYKLMWLPPAMWGNWQQIIMPALALSALPAAYISRLARTSILEILQREYVLTARAKGLSRISIFFRHILKNSILSVVTYLGYLIASIFTGSFVVENIFAIPGLGRYFVTSILNRDYTLILGLTVFYAVFLMAMNLLVDIFYLIIDPRIRTIGKE
ncbi:MAG: ABC transporter permease [Peptococcaceae bacterium]|nr:ABC transporter permease [Peptococcaceae bacterium]